MKTDYKFYVAKLGEKTSINAGYSWASGRWEPVANNKISSTPEISVSGFSRLVVSTKYKKALTTTIYFMDKNRAVINTKQIQGSSFDEMIPARVSFMAVETEFSVENSGWDDYTYICLKEVMPHYKNLKKQQKKENSQMLFRESLDGKISLWNRDYEFIKSASVEDKLGFYVYKSETRFSSNEFTKSDCKFNHFRNSVELKLKPQDQYTKILDSYKKTYDLAKLPVGKSAISFTKRCAIQLYVQGTNVVTSYVGGTWWEDEVTEAVYDENALLTKYYFAKGPFFSEVSLSGFNYDINSVYICSSGSSIWNGISTRVVGGVKYRIPCSIKFELYARAGDFIWSDSVPESQIRLMSDGTSSGATTTTTETGVRYVRFTYDTYRIAVYTGPDGTGSKIYQSKCVYGNNSDFIIAQGAGLYEMNAIDQPIPAKYPTPELFYLGEKVINYQIWGRLLCDVSVSADGTTLHDLPYDDFIIERANFKKCIGLSFSTGDKSIIHFKQSTESQDGPTPYGLDDYGEYFKAPMFYSVFNGERLFAYPLARSTWGNSSLWIAQENFDQFGIEHWTKNFYKEIWHRDCMELGAVIKALLQEIDPAVTFESSTLYSEFLYSSAPEMQAANGLIYITQKSNVLKGEYDQAAQRAEITLAQIMDMLRDCFRCYWFIDSENRFRIEHVRYFINGGSYSVQAQQIDLTQRQDKFNKKPVLYDQREVSYVKSDLASRYEFAWADNVTDAMGGGFYVDVMSNLVEPEKIESINVDLFTPDLDLMMLKPSDFSQDGFALLIAKDGKVPIAYSEIYSQAYEYAPMKVYVQNYFASFIKLFENYLYDMPGQSIHASVDQSYSRYKVKNRKRCMEHTIEVAFEPAVNAGSINTDLGKGYIENVTTDVDTHISSVTLLYEPV